MTEQEALDLVSDMKTRWFSNWQPDRDVEQMWLEYLIRLPSAEDARRAIVQHRADAGNRYEPKLVKVRETMSAIRRSVAGDGERKSVPLVETLRLHMRLGGHVSDFEVWIRYYRSVFVTKARARESEQRPIWMQCYHQLASMGVPGMDGGGSWENSTAGRVAWMAVCDEHTYGFELADALRLCEVAQRPEAA